MKHLEITRNQGQLRGQTGKAKLAGQASTQPTVKPAGKPASKLAGEASNSISRAALETLSVWRKHHLDYAQSKHVVERVRRELKLEPPSEKRRTVERLDRDEIERLIGAAYKRSSKYGLMVKTLFYTGARVNEFVNIGVQDLHLGLEPPQVYLAQAKMGSDGFVPIIEALSQELRTHLNGRKVGYLFESRRFDKFTPRMVQLVVKEAARAAGIEQRVTPHRLRASVATILLDAGMPLDHVQKFLRHKRIATTQIYAQTSLGNLGSSYQRVLER